ncbi:MAG: hypothetical protein IH621_13415 [Krumholzibacteria bacterium]|nr:hypothetical protein [Candidatus Krumholzibacteria bacterium]
MKRAKGFLTISAVRDVLLVAAIAIVVWKLAGATFVINMDKFGFVELLATLMAFFAIGLSVAFYFKATETSNTFYDNVYHFTKDTSEILGRIEAGFGERLRHLDEGYSGLREKFDRIPFDVNEAKEEVEKEQKEVEKKEAEKQELLENLAERAKLAEGEKLKLFEELKSRDESLENARRELFRLRRKIEQAEIREGVPEELAHYLIDALPAVFDLDRRKVLLSSRLLIEKFNDSVDGLRPEALRDMRRFDLVDETDSLTRKGVFYLRDLVKSRK